MLRIWETTVTSYSYTSPLNGTSFRATRFLDSAASVPGTNMRFGTDALLNLIPGVGTLTFKGSRSI